MTTSLYRTQELAALTGQFLPDCGLQDDGRKFVRCIIGAERGREVTVDGRFLDGQVYLVGGQVSVHH